MRKAKSAAPWRNRIVGEGEEAPDQLLANPMNFRIHSAGQQEAMGEVLEKVGLVQRVIVNRTTGHLLDGHMRVTLALRRSEPTVPVLYCELTEEEERLVLATFDPIGSLAVVDREALERLRAGMALESAMLREALVSMAAGGAGPVMATVTGPSLVDRFLVPPFSVLDARQGYWQARKAQWLATGIDSELGRGERAGEKLTMSATGQRLKPSADQAAKRRRANATPGGSAMPAANYSRRARGDGRGRPLA